jgi:hypothetical protein
MRQPWNLPVAGDIGKTALPVPHVLMNFIPPSMQLTEAQCVPDVISQS